MSYIKLEEDNVGQFLVSNYGAGIAIGIKGPPAFVTRFINFVKNFGLNRSGQLNSLGFDCIYYITTTWDRLRKALIEYYQGQIILNGLVAPTHYELLDGEIEIPIYNEDKVLNKANELTEKFIANNLVTDNFMQFIEKQGMKEFSIAG